MEKSGLRGKVFEQMLCGNGSEEKHSYVSLYTCLRNMDKYNYVPQEVHVD